jgi:methionyl-tRNA formyltransferase
VNVVLFAFCPSSTAYVDALGAAGTPPRWVVTGARSSGVAPVAAACARWGIPLERSEDVNAPSFVERLRALAPELLVVAGCSQILRPAVLAVPSAGAVNFHPSLLPDDRGKEPLFWALLRGARTVGVTAHHITAEVDGGPILWQREVEVPEGATSASLAREVDRVGAGWLGELLDRARRGRLPEGRAPDRAGSHHPPLRAEHGLLDFTRSAVELCRLVRACTGEVHAYCFFRGMRLVVLATEPSEPIAAAPPGRVLAVGPAAVEVATASGSLRILRWLFLDRAYAPDALARDLGLRAGDALTANPAF